MTDTISWYAVRVAPKAEFRVQGAISRLERPAIMPFGERSVARENRPSLRRWRKYPIIPGYVFAGFFNLTDFVSVRMAINSPLEHRGQPKDILGLVGFGNKPAVLSQADVELLSTMTDTPPVEEVPFSVVSLKDKTLHSVAGRRLLLNELEPLFVTGLIRDAENIR